MLHAMPRKRPRTDADVEKLAAEFRERWTPAHGITPWLRRMGPRLHRMVRDDSWAWADIGRALTLAGVTYESGRPWTGTLLMVKAAQARKQIRDRGARATAAVGTTHASSFALTPAPVHQPSSTPLQVEQSSFGLGRPDEMDEPTFALASLSSSEFRDPKPPRIEAATPKAASTRPRVNADEILRRLQGGPTSTDRKD